MGVEAKSLLGDVPVVVDVPFDCRGMYFYKLLYGLIYIFTSKFISGCFMFFTPLFTLVMVDFCMILPVLFRH